MGEEGLAQPNDSQGQTDVLPNVGQLVKFSLPVDTMDEIINWVPIKISKRTLAPPGSRAKIEEMRNRVSRGEQLWDSEDVDYS